MKKTTLALVVGAALSLAGCDGTTSPAGVGAGTSESNTGAVSEALAREKALTVAREQGTAQQVQLSALIVNAVQELRPTWKGEFNTGLDSTVCALGLDLDRRQEAIDAVQADAGVIVPGMELDVIARGTQAELNAACLAWFWSEATQPRMGWPRGSQRGFSPERQAEMRHWAALQLGIVLGSSESLADIAAQLAQLPGASTEELSERARTLLIENANEYRAAQQAVYLEMESKADSVVLDLANASGGPHFRLAEYDYQAGPGGSLVSQSGSVLFGEGYLGATRYVVEAVTTSGQSLAQRSTDTTSNEASNTATTSAEARTQ